MAAKRHTTAVALRRVDASRASAERSRAALRRRGCAEDPAACWRQARRLRPGGNAARRCPF